MANLFLYAIGLAVLAMVSVVCKIVAGTWNPFVVARGEDGRPSTSKLQFWLWTLVALFSYTALYAARAWHGFFASLEEVPRNLLLAMGFSNETTFYWLARACWVLTPRTCPSAPRVLEAAIALVFGRGSARSP
jgi:hypothetical protein